MSAQFYGCIKPKKSFRKKRKTPLSLYRSRRQNLKRPAVNIPNVSSVKAQRLEINADIVNPDYHDTSPVEHQFRVNVPPESHSELLDANSSQPQINVHFAHLTEYERNCAQIIQDAATIAKLVRHLNNYEMLQHFVNLYTSLAESGLSPLEIPILLCLERATFHTLKSTTNMTFHPVTKRFFAMGYRLFGNSFLEFCGGPKSYGQIIAQQSHRGQYDPRTAKVNFVVPHRRHLNYSEVQLHKEIPPGIIDHTLDLVQNKSDQILMIDGKKIARSLRPGFVGDENLWGLEGPQSLDEVRAQLETELDSLNTAERNIITMGDQRKLNNIEFHIKLISNRIREIRQKQQKIKRRLLYSERKHAQAGQLKRYQYAITACKTYLYSTYLWIDKALSCIAEFVSYAAIINGNLNEVIINSPCTLTQKLNVKLLLEPKVLLPIFHGEVPCEYVKQRTPEWHLIRDAAVVTASSAYNALGFRQQAELDAHFEHMVYKRSARQFTEEAGRNMAHGVENEVSLLTLLPLLQ